MNEILINNNIQAEDLESKLKETTSLTEQQIQEIVPVILNTLSEIKEMENKKAEDSTREDLSNLTQDIQSNVSIDMRNNKGTVIGAMNFNTITNNIIITINQTEVQPNVQTEVQPSTQTEVQPSTQTEVQPSAQTEVQPSTQTEVQPSAQTEVQPSAQTEVQPNVQTEVQPNVQTEVQPNVQTEVQPNVQTEVQSSTQTEVEYVSQNTDTIDIRTPSGFLTVLNKLLEEIEDTKNGISKKGLSKSGKKAMDAEKLKLKQYKQKITAKKEKLEKTMRKGSTPQIYETDIQQVVMLKSDIDAVRKGVSLGQWGELSNLGSFLYNSPENAKKSNRKQENINQFESKLKQEVKDGAIKNIFGNKEQVAIDFYRRIAEGRYTQADYALFTAQSHILSPSFQRCGIAIPLAPNLVQTNGGIVEVTQGSPRKSADYGNLDRGETFQQGGLAGVVDKALGNCKNMTPGQRNAWKSIAVLGGVAAGIFGLYKFYTSKKMGFWGKAGITAAAILGSQIATGEGPISLFNKLLTGGFSQKEFESKFGNAFGDAVNGVGNSGIESSYTLAPAMYSMMIFNSSTNVGQIRAMTSKFETDENAWGVFRGEAINKLRNKYGEKSVENFSATFTDKFEKEKWINWLASFGVTDSCADSVKIYEIANNASMNEIILEKFKEDNGLKVKSDKKKELDEYMKSKKENNQAISISELEKSESIRFELDNDATFTNREKDITNIQKLTDQVNDLSLDDTTKAELVKEIKTFYNERTIASKPNPDDFNLKMENGKLILTSRNGHNAEIDVTKKELVGFGNGAIRYTRLSHLLNTADIANKILESQKGKNPSGNPVFDYKMERKGICFNGANSVWKDIITRNNSGMDTRVLSTGRGGATSKIEQLCDRPKEFAEYLSARRIKENQQRLSA